ncbi:hypothetical protein TNCV_1731411 [Trichonephila clavipes]|nr:hypothetical protein TNCV_1731411 [Trichonephila clavipes]
MSARRCLGMTGNHNFPSGSKILPAKDTVDKSEFFVLDELLKSFNFCKVFILFLFHRKVHTVVTAKNLSGVSVSSSTDFERASASLCFFTGFIFYVKIMLLKCRRAHLASLPEGSPLNS